MNYKQILIGTDGGDLMAPVYDHAAYLARLTDATVHIAYVLGAPDLRHTRSTHLQTGTT